MDGRTLGMPRRGSFYHHLYVDIVCLLKTQHALPLIAPMVAAERNISEEIVWWVYRKFVRPQLRAGTPIVRLV